MKLLHLEFTLFFFLATIICFVKADNETSRFNKIKALTAKSPKGLIELSENDFDELVTKSSSYNSVVLLTATDPKYGCSECHEAVKKMEAMADHMKRFGNSDKIYFIKLEPERAMSVFRKFQVNSPPKLILFPSFENRKGAKGKSVVQLDISEASSASEIAKKLTEATGIKVRALEPVNYVKMLSYVLSGLAIYTTYTMMKRNDMTFFKLLYGVSSALLLVSVLMMTSGFLWNKIKKPAASRGGDSLASYISSGLQNQYSNEPVVISSCYGIAASSFIFMIKRAPKIDNSTVRAVVTILSLVVIVVSTSYLYMFFRIKNQSYPYKLLF